VPLPPLFFVFVAFVAALASALAAFLANEALTLAPSVMMARAYR